MMRPHHARIPCNTKPVVMHGNRATRTPEYDPRHARLGVQHPTPQPCTTTVQHTLHPRGCNIGQPLLDNRSRHAHSCKTDQRIFRSLIARLRKPGTTEVTNRPRGRNEGAGAAR